MRIIHIADFGKSGNINGIGAAVLNLAEAQEKLGLNVNILYTRQNNYINNPNCIRVENTKKFKETISVLKPDVVIFHSFYDFKHPLFAFILKLCNIPYLITFHGGASLSNYKKHRLLKLIANNLIFKPYVKNANATIYLNEGERANSIFSKIDKNKYKILPNGIAGTNLIHRFNSNKEITITFMSRLDYYGKGIDVLLNAIRLIETKLLEQSVRFNFYGYNYNDGTVEKIINSSSICKYCGYVLDALKNEAYLETDIVILPSRSEGMPINILEALSYGIPCIITPHTNMGEILRQFNCGWISQLDPEELSKSILYAVRDYRANHNILSYNAVSAAKNYSWDNIASKSFQLYTTILSKM